MSQTNQHKASTVLGVSLSQWGSYAFLNHSIDGYYNVCVGNVHRWCKKLAPWLSQTPYCTSFWCAKLATIKTVSYACLIALLPSWNCCACLQYLRKSIVLIMFQCYDAIITLSTPHLSSIHMWKYISLRQRCRRLNRDKKPENEADWLRLMNK